MRVAPDFLAPLLEGFRDPDVFAVSCQIFFSDPAKLREETGLTQGWWQDGGLRVRHRIDPAVDDLFPCFYGGGGSCAFDRAKFLELGGFDPLLAPFYLEDTDLGYLAWKRGWKVLYQPRSVVYHEHRGTIGKRFSDEQIQAVLKKNYLLFCWKNIHEWRRLAVAFLLRVGGRAAERAVRRRSRPGRTSRRSGALSASCRRPLRSRWRARGLPRVDRYGSLPAPAGRLLPRPLRRHGTGARQAARAVRFALSDLPAGARRRRLHVPDAARNGEAHRSPRGRAAGLALAGEGQRGTAHVLRLRRVDRAAQRQAQGLRVASAARRPRVRQRRSGVADPPPDLPLENRRAAARIHRHGAVSRRVPPHRRPRCSSTTSTFSPSAAAWATCPRAMRRSEGAPRIPARAALRTAHPALAATRCRSARRPTATTCFRFFRSCGHGLQAGLRAGIDTARYQFRPDGREPLTMLFLGSFRHDPNRVALDWFVRQVLPLILARQPAARLVVAGSDPPPRPHLCRLRGLA